jgi:hypothetical protein
VSYHDRRGHGGALHVDDVAVAGAAGRQAIGAPEPRAGGRQVRLDPPVEGRTPRGEVLHLPGSEALMIVWVMRALLLKPSQKP